MYKAARADARAVDKQAQRLTAAAKKELGLWSDYGISKPPPSLSSPNA